jgi:hypothetical protein
MQLAGSASLEFSSSSITNGYLIFLLIKTISKRILEVKVAARFTFPDSRIFPNQGGVLLLN